MPWSAEVRFALALALVAGCAVASTPSALLSQVDWERAVPEAVLAPAVVYDAVRGQAVLFGGIGDQVPPTTTAQFDGARWRGSCRPRRSSAPRSPSAS